MVGVEEGGWGSGMIYVGRVGWCDGVEVEIEIEK